NLARPGARGRGASRRHLVAGSARGLNPGAQVSAGRARADLVGWSGSALRLVVLDAMDALAVAVVGALDAPLLARADAAVVGARHVFHVVDMRLAALHARVLAVGELAGLHAVGQTLLLVRVALRVGLQSARRGRVRVARDRVVLVLVDSVAVAVLHVLDLRVLGLGHRAVAHVALLGAVQVRLALFQVGCLARVELAGLQALVDALLLVRVALGVAGRVLGWCALRLYGGHAAQPAQAQQADNQPLLRMVLHGVLLLLVVPPVARAVWSGERGAKRADDTPTGTCSGASRT